MEKFHRISDMLHYAYFWATYRITFWDFMERKIHSLSQGPGISSIIPGHVFFSDLTLHFFGLKRFQ